MVYGGRRSFWRQAATRPFGVTFQGVGPALFAYHLAVLVGVLAVSRQAPVLEFDTSTSSVRRLKRTSTSLARAGFGSD